MWLNQLRKDHIIDATAYALGRYINGHNTYESIWPGLLCALSIQAIKQGHTCLDCSRIAEQFPALLNYPDLLQYIDLSALQQNPMIGQNILQKDTLFTFAKLHVFCNNFFNLESRLLRAVAARINSLDYPHITNATERLAVLCLLKPLCILSGGPGTGKTTCLTQSLPLWVELFSQKFNRLPKIALCAPTGKAAARMTSVLLEHKMHLAEHAISEAQISCIPDQANTLHRLLGINPLTKQPRYTLTSPLMVDLVVVDEASMIDLPLFVQLIEAIPNTAHLLLIGDPNQLPAIEAGNMLGGLLNSASSHPFFAKIQLAHLHLAVNHRQTNHPGLSQLAHDCLLEAPEHVIDNLTNHHYSNVTWHENSAHVLTEIIHFAAKQYAALAIQDNALAALLTAKKITLLTAVRNGPYGCSTINYEIARILNPSFQPNYHGQLLLITENAKHLGLANGDIVIVWRQTNGQLLACFDNNGVLHTLELTALPAYELGYALTIHKSQGSEYEQLIIILPEQDSQVLSKALLYTAVTRAKQNLWLIGTKQALICSLLNATRRVNGLEFLADQLAE
jgi:exodeoxyribonuclease V alpha subunit